MDVSTLLADQSGKKKKKGMFSKSLKLRKLVPSSRKPVVVGEAMLCNSYVTCKHFKELFSLLKFHQTFVAGGRCASARAIHSFLEELQEL